MRIFTIILFIFLTLSFCFSSEILDDSEINGKTVNRVLLMGKDFNTGNIFSLTGSGSSGILWSNSYINEISLGNIDTVTTKYQFGLGTIGTSDFETVWDYSSSSDYYNWIITAETLYISSSATTDVFGSTGAFTVEVKGLDSNYDMISERKALNGRTTVETTYVYKRINDFYVIDVGSSGYNNGNIYLHKSSGMSSGTPTETREVYAKISTLKGNIQSCLYTVPRGHKILIHGISYVVGQNAISFTVQLYARKYNESWRVISQDKVYSGNLQTDFRYPLMFPEKTDIAVRARAGTSATISCYLYYTLHQEIE
ncbi:MAG: hypothetical protein ABIJ17_02505 [Patescibacteria group bacterium]